MCACVRACVRARAHTRASTHERTQMRNCTREHTHTHTISCEPARACPSPHAHAHACAQARTAPKSARTHALVSACVHTCTHARARACVCVWGVGQAGRRASIFLAGRFSSMFYFGPWITLMFTLNLAEILRFLGLLEKRWRFAGCSRRVGVPISVKLLFVFRGLARWVPLVIRLRRAAVAPKHSHLDGLSPASPKVSMGRKAGRPTIKCVLGRV